MEGQIDQLTGIYTINGDEKSKMGGGYKTDNASTNDGSQLGDDENYGQSMTEEELSDHTPSKSTARKK